MNHQMLIDEAVDMKEWALHKLQNDARVQLALRADHAVASGIPSWMSLTTAGRWYADAVEMLKQSETFVWTKETQQKAIHAADKLPMDVPFHQSWLPAQTGFWWLGRDPAWTLPCETSRDRFPDLPLERRICAIQYTVKEGFVLMEALTLDHREPTKGPTTCLGCAWNEGETMTQFLQRVWDNLVGHRYADSDANVWWRLSTELFGRRFMASCLWMQQRVVAVSPHHVSGPQRKRALKLTMNATTKIITLRRTDTGHSESTGEGMPLLWRIPVIGHWRNQPYKDGRITPIWIDEHWRGPDDAPVKAPSRIIYKVAR